MEINNYKTQTSKHGKFEFKNASVTNASKPCKYAIKHANMRCFVGCHSDSRQSHRMRNFCRQTAAWRAQSAQRKWNNAKLVPPDGGAENQTAKNQSEGATVSTDLTLSSQDFRSRCKMFVAVAQTFFVAVNAIVADIVTRALYLCFVSD